MKIEKVPISEAALHRSIRNLLQVKGIVYFESTFGRRTTMQLGMPDFVFAAYTSRISHAMKMIPGHVANAWECKIGNKQLTPEQDMMFRKLQYQPNCWKCTVIRSLDQAIEELEALGI